MDQSPKTFEQRLDGLFDKLRHAAERPQPPERKVAIISTERCGSKYFCESLANTGKFGYPAEWLNTIYVEAFFRVFRPGNLTFSEYLNFITSRTTSSNGIFSLNFHVDQYMHWQKQGVDLLSIGFDRIYYLRRKNKLAQALSYAKALATGQWRSSDRPSADISIGQVTKPMVLETLYKLSLMDEFYEKNLASHVHKIFDYEDFSRNTSCFHEVLRDCGVEHKDISEISCGLQIQRTENDAAFLRKLEKYLGCGMAER
jgi:LPS sulfotransferase NodH